MKMYLGLFDSYHSVFLPTNLHANWILLSLKAHLINHLFIQSACQCLNTLFRKYYHFSTVGFMATAKATASFLTTSKMDFLIALNNQLLRYYHQGTLAPLAIIKLGNAMREG